MSDSWGQLKAMSLVLGLRRQKKKLRRWTGGFSVARPPFSNLLKLVSVARLYLWTNVTDPGLSHYVISSGLLLSAKVSGGQAGTFWARREVSDWRSHFEVFLSWQCCFLKLWDPQEVNSIRAHIKEQRYSVSVIAPLKETGKKTRKSPCSLSITDFPVAGAQLLGNKWCRVGKVCFDWCFSPPWQEDMAKKPQHRTGVDNRTPLIGADRKQRTAPEQKLSFYLQRPAQEVNFCQLGPTWKAQ